MLDLTNGRTSNRGRGTTTTPTTSLLFYLECRGFPLVVELVVEPLEDAGVHPAGAGLTRRPRGAVGDAVVVGREQRERRALGTFAFPWAVGCVGHEGTLSDSSIHCMKSMEYNNTRITSTTSVSRHCALAFFIPRISTQLPQVAHPRWGLRRLQGPRGVAEEMAGLREQRDTLVMVRHIER